jgi:hypothetical protein
MNKRPNWLLIILAAIGLIVVAYFVIQALDGDNIGEEIGEGIEEAGEDIEDAVD